MQTKADGVGVETQVFLRTSFIDKPNNIKACNRNSLSMGQPGNHADAVCSNGTHINCAGYMP